MITYNIQMKNLKMNLNNQRKKNRKINNKRKKMYNFKHNK